jgi:putative mRNA 3-end processing factor
MSGTFNVDVAASGAVLLGDHVACDGFHRTRKVRVQTHVHDDHMFEFETSKGEQDIFMSEATHQLLVAEFNADLPYRTNVVPLPYELQHQLGHWRLSLIPSGHMLGSAQVVVERDDGLRLGYSGDFHWPIEDVIRCDELVVDATYGSPESVRRYTQEQAEQAFYEILSRSLPRGPVLLKAFRGTMQRALRVISDVPGCTFVGSARLKRELDVYAGHGYPVPPLVVIGTPPAREALRQPRCVRLISKGDPWPIESPNTTTIVLSAYMANGTTPFVERSDRSYSVALSDHADFTGTLDFIRASGAKKVVTDNTRCKGVELAAAIRAELGIAAMHSSHAPTNDWGT